MASCEELREGIELLVCRWGALQNHPQHHNHLTFKIYQFLTTPSSEALYHVDKLANLIDDFMLSLNTEIDDGSIDEMADNLTILRKECLEGNFSSIKLLRRQSFDQQHIQVMNGDEDDSEPLENMADNLSDTTVGYP
ncbi:hypothetical protein QVD17_15264 [Tagetes erecta]|uniref:Pre-rRNA-processing protein TSR2 homolog n=1 Tax=Tagetes erecta TaxID=13708 RepID=A0AAD8NYH8_TARER|nr:hypothetical protein QVD17_15264 [Tagetes erecta]